MSTYLILYIVLLNIILKPLLTIKNCSDYLELAKRTPNSQAVRSRLLICHIPPPFFLLPLCAAISNRRYHGQKCPICKWPHTSLQAQNSRNIITGYKNRFIYGVSFGQIIFCEARWLIDCLTAHTFHFQYPTTIPCNP